VVSVVANLTFVQIPQCIPHGAGGVGGKVAFGWIEMPGGIGERFLGG
jgi:hypothetical protein